MALTHPLSARTHPLIALTHPLIAVVYREGPAFYHASFSVLVRPVVEATLRPDPLFPPPGPLTWRTLAAHNRVTENVKKVP